MYTTGQSRGRSNFRGARPAIAIAVLLVAAGIAINMSTGSANAAEKKAGSSQKSSMEKKMAEARKKSEAAKKKASDAKKSDAKKKSGDVKANESKDKNSKDAKGTTEEKAADGKAAAGDKKAADAKKKDAAAVKAGSAKGAADAKAAAATAQVKPLATNCDKSDLELHTGFQDAPRCVKTSFGEVSEADKNPTLLITAAPNAVQTGDAFSMTVSTRNLVRDRFLAAAAGGYYLESSLLTSDGLNRGHFHTACRMLDSTSVAPEPDEVPAFFKATEDGKGGATPDSVTVEIPDGLPEKGTAQCAIWAGDGSHRIPMMQRANQIPAFDSVRIKVN